ncbi:DUF1064 domain-containing protein [Alteraurantiacibacter buctensis]|uniref:DUF1064 domain-containing protein n=1 Tax=Alteraurantiacibacter buctensis TaxID=1503981 RepID=A0A844Z2Z4_9SPHN|nr:DUF1064 domain-containing protein [Alteraurantiacibacter buctensis]
MKRYFARKTLCVHGHTHASSREASRCADLHLRERLGEITNLQVEPQFWFQIDGQPIKHLNGRRVGYKPDFTYTELPSQQDVAEDVKAKNGHMERDVPLRMAIFRHLFPHIELRVVK